MAASFIVPNFMCSRPEFWAIPCMHLVLIKFGCQPYLWQTDVLGVYVSTRFGRSCNGTYPERTFSPWVVWYLGRFFRSHHYIHRSTEYLIRIDAFRFTKVNKQELLWKAHLYLNKHVKIDHPKLFPPKHQDFKIPTLHTTNLEMVFTQWELLGFCLCFHSSLITVIIK